MVRMSIGSVKIEIALPEKWRLKFNGIVWGS